MTSLEFDWPSALRAADNSAAVLELHRILQNGLRIALAGRGDICEAHLEDFAQDALMKVLSRVGDFQGRSKFTTWAHSIAVNVALTELRRKRYRDISLDQFMEDGRHLAEAIADTSIPEKDEARDHLVHTLQRAVAEKLSDKQRAIITAALAGQPFDQTVQFLGTNRNAAYKLLHDARRVLKSALIAEGISEETIRTTFAS
jgi:RNA polymerase sigma-70 factor (ECF subfamily)